MRKIATTTIVMLLAAGTLSGCGILAAGAAGGALGAAAAKKNDFNPAQTAETGASTVYHDAKKGVSNAYEAASPYGNNPPANTYSTTQ